MPFVIGGGPCTYNPEPLADFFDLFYIGEGETSYDALLDLYKEWKKGDASREAFCIRRQRYRESMFRHSMKSAIKKMER